MKRSNPSCGRSSADGMRLRMMTLAAAGFVAVAGVALAQGAGAPPEKPAYVEMLKGDQYRERGERVKAAECYRQAIELFQVLRREQPAYKPDAIQYRLDYVRQQLEALVAAGVVLPPPAPAAAEKPPVIVPPGGVVPPVAVPPSVESDLARLRARVAELEERNGALEDQIKAATPTPAEARAEAALKERIRQLQAAFDQLSEDRIRLRKETEAALKQAERAAQLEKQLKDATGLADQYKKAATGRDSEKRALQQKVDDLTRQVGGLEKERQASSDALAKAGQQAAALQKQLDEQAKTVDDLKKQMRSEDTITAPYRKQIAELTDSLDASRLVQLRAVKQVETLQQDLTAAKKGASDAQTRIAELERRVAELGRESAPLLKQIDGLKAQVADQGKKGAALTTALEEKEKALRAAEDATTAARREADTLKRKLNSDDERTAPLRTEIARLEKELKTIQKEKATALSDLEDSRKKTADVSQTLAAAQQEAARLRQQARSARTAEMEKQLAAAVAEKQKLQTEMDSQAGKAREAQAALERRVRELESAAEQAAEEAAVQEREIRRLRQQGGASAPAPAPEPAADPASRLTEAEALLARKDGRGAARAFTEVLAARPDDPKALQGLIGAQLLARNPNAARQAAIRLGDTQPDSAEFLHAAGVALTDCGDAAGAVKYLEAAVKLDGKNTGYVKTLGAAYYQCGRLPQAVEQFRAVTTLDPKDGKAHFNLAVLLASMTPPQIDEARANYEKALALGEPKDASLEKILKK